MTVARQQSITFPASVSEVAWAIRSVLRDGHWMYSYRQAVEAEDASSFHAVIFPRLWPLFLSTRLLIELRRESEGTSVILHTESQPYITGDVFNSYRRYLRNTVTAIGRQLSRQV
jgi:hypothetical protein